MSIPNGYSMPKGAFHTNSIQVLDGSWAVKEPAFIKGDLLIDIRNMGLIICIDPEKEKIVWLMDKTFWNKGQHFAKLLDNGNILLFDNYYRPDISRVVKSTPWLNKWSGIIPPKTAGSIPALMANVTVCPTAIP